jgi:hypothetical protein
LYGIHPPNSKVQSGNDYPVSHSKESTKQRGVDNLSFKILKLRNYAVLEIAGNLEWIAWVKTPDLLRTLRKHLGHHGENFTLFSNIGHSLHIVVKLYFFHFVIMDRRLFTKLAQFFKFCRYQRLTILKIPGLVIVPYLPSFVELLPKISRLTRRTHDASPEKRSWNQVSSVGDDGAQGFPGNASRFSPIASS